MLYVDGVDHFRAYTEEKKLIFFGFAHAMRELVHYQTACSDAYALPELATGIGAASSDCTQRN